MDHLRKIQFCSYDNFLVIFRRAIYGLHVSGCMLSIPTHEHTAKNKHGIVHSWHGEFDHVWSWSPGRFNLGNFRYTKEPENYIKL